MSKKTEFEKEIEVKFINAIEILMPFCENVNDIPFIFEFDDTIEELGSGLDEMVSFWTLPTMYGKVITFERILNRLILQDKTPRWIKLSLRFDKQIILTISKRFRGKKENRHKKNNPLQPFKIVENENSIIEKTLERFFSKQKLFDYELELLVNQQFSKESISKLIAKNFSKSTFYPNKFVKFSPVQASYKGFVIEKFAENDYVLHEQKKGENDELMILPDKFFTNLEEIIDAFISQFLTIYDLKIITNY